MGVRIDLMAFLAIGLLAYGLWLIYEPAMFLFLGVVALGVAFVTKE